MKLLKYPVINSLYFAVTTAIYAATFIIATKYCTDLPFHSGDAFRYIGLAMIAATMLVTTVSMLRRKKYDEYQVNILGKILIINGLISTLLFPCSILFLTFVAGFYTEALFTTMLLQWLVILFQEIIYLVKTSS